MQTLLTRFRARDRAVSSSSGSRSTTSTDTNETQMPTTPSTPPPMPSLHMGMGYAGSSDTPTTPTRITTQYERKIHPHVDALLEEYASAPSSPTSVTSPLSPGRLGHYDNDMPGGLAPAPPATPYAHKETSTPPTVSRVPSDSTTPITPVRPPRAHTRAPSSGSPLPISPEHEQLSFEPSDPTFFDTFEQAHYGRSYSGSSSPTIDSQGRFRRLSRVSLPGAADVWSTFGRRSVEGERERPLSVVSVPSVSAVGGGRGGPSAWFMRKGKGKGGSKKRRSREGSVRSAASSAEGSGSGHGSVSGHGHAGNISKESSGNATMDRSGNTSGSKDGGGSTRSSRKGKENRALPSPPGSAFQAPAPGVRPGSAFGTPLSPATGGGPISPALSAFNAPSVSTLASPIPSLHQAAGLPASVSASPQSSFASPFAINIAVQPPTRTGSPMRAVPMGYGHTYPQERERRMSVDEAPTPRRGGRQSGGAVGVELQGAIGITSQSPGTQRKHAPLRAYRSVPRANAIFPSSSPFAASSGMGVPSAVGSDGEVRRPSAALFAAQALQEEDENDFGRVEWPARVSGEIIRLSLGSPSRRESALSSAAYSRRSALSSASGTTELGDRVQGEELQPGRKSIDTVGTFGPRAPGRVARTLSDGRAGAMATRPKPNPNPNIPLSLPASTTSSYSPNSPYRAFETLNAHLSSTNIYSGASAASDAYSPSPSTYTTSSTGAIALSESSAMQNEQQNTGLLMPGPSTPGPSAPTTPRQTKPLRSSLRSRPGASPASFADSGLGIRSTATRTYPSDAARLLAEKIAREGRSGGEDGDGLDTPTGKGKGKGKRKADEAEVTPPDVRRARFGLDVDELGALPAAFAFSHAPTSYSGPSRNPKRARLSSPEPRPPSAQGQNSNQFGRAQSRASSRPQSRGTTDAANARREKRASLSGASIPISALVTPHAPSMSHLTNGSYRMRDPRKPATRKMHTPWSLRRRDAEAGDEGSPIHAWLFYLGFVTLVAWLIGAFWRVPRTRVLKEGGDEEKGRDVLVDDPQVEFDARRWRIRCRVMAGVGLCTYVPFVVLVGVFVGR